MDHKYLGMHIISVMSKTHELQFTFNIYWSLTLF